MAESTNPSQQPLSPEGLIRREQLLLELTQHMATLHRRRRAVRWGLSTGAATLSVLLVLVLMLPRRTDPSHTVMNQSENHGRFAEDTTASAFVRQALSPPMRTGIVDTVTADITPSGFVTLVETDASVGARAIVRSHQPDTTGVSRDMLAQSIPADRDLVQVLTDVELLELLASIGRPAGLVRFGDDIFLSAPVSDAELGSEWNGRTVSPSDRGT